MAIEESRDEVWKMFDRISPRYDLVNRLLSFGIDHYWRRQLIRHLPQKKGLRLLDLATGTGDQLITIVKRAKQVETALGLDMSQEMVRLGQRKIIDKPYTHRITLAEGDATNIALEKGSVDCVTMSFGIRNVTSVEKCLEECFRVLTPSGKLMILELSLPKNRFIRGLHLFYLRRILPLVGGLVSREPKAYLYLNKTIETFPYGEAFCTKLKSAGFYRVKAYPMTFGAATLYIGEKVPCGNHL
ncbi:bifunctional demethylmenaquinone methyltransferase/2-methoxy-6-polyprenyl-1,4-benzoquinol methylase UbiE [Candidatus Neptunochlamydia vexilliferae]|uniref:Demethylmenaquinone methyltransferase n=1 Tax=Candidatus Neptunichlamydia vexilliferae TaxID=1651774 RepID=A0ABS0AWZ4_9BACT|nr:bifunctional demethylmenaquinone methyltransferase/2-methoxy-6-polyprenyl-1,4-benzoquinol methylase UbiE [Candidatus Neptunochlamydia vexilliferae]MBF5058653.1 Ubiquinone/menaquinone biosynthesis C-methyltransferase UbiE [Candidatus Neptunochlamydia vexilliferae]